MPASLAERLAARIAATGPITVADYMASALSDPDFGYYARADSTPLGAPGDFTTAPEISQLFGELIGAWLIDCWRQAGSPHPVNLVELGPGRGTLMADIMRVARAVPEWRAAIRLHLVEINPALRRSQAAALAGEAPVWHDTPADIPDGPIMLVANEFLDALPIRQLVFWGGKWRERTVGWSAEAGFHFTLSPGVSALSLLMPPDLRPDQGAVFEISPAVFGAVTEIGRRIARHGGAALLVDYGYDAVGYGETLQAVEAHGFTDTLADPGAADLSAHVDFAALAAAGKRGGAGVHGPVGQGALLMALGLAARAQALAARHPGEAAALQAALARLTGEAAMGTLFKALAFLPTAAVTAPGFADTGAAHATA